MKLTLVCDHRIIDGVDAGNFLKDLKILIENIKID
jgi:pyruvate/2-oxoglutarate dehydrogenase complex dihydrolipoamide acyltransferase (E2) component